MRKHSIATITTALLIMFPNIAGAQMSMSNSALDIQTISKAAGVQATADGDVVRIGWTRNDVAVTVDGMQFLPAAGLGSWAAFKPMGMGGDAMVMGDTVVFQDEVDAAMDAAFATGLSVTALHNHFFYDEPKVFYMHISGQGPAPKLASGVKAVWDAIKQVRASNPQPARQFPGAVPQQSGKIDNKDIESITGLKASINPGGVVKILTGRSGSMLGTEIGGSMGLTSWAAFSGSDDLAVMDGDFIMAADEVQQVLKTLRGNGVHIVALHNHMIGEKPAFFFTHFWGKGTAADLAMGFKAAHDVQKQVQEKK
jgi:hypothetical protein